MTIECGDADLAFELIEASHPDVLLADIALPGFHNGITVAGRVRRELGIPHIYTTSFTREEIIRQAEEKAAGEGVKAEEYYWENYREIAGQWLNYAVTFSEKSRSEKKEK